MNVNSISVLIPAHNMGHYLFRAVSSVVWQLHPEDDIIIVDDASTDTQDRGGIQPFMDRVKWLRNDANLGCAGSRNRGIQASQAEWIKFLDADDVLAPFALDCVRDDEIPGEIKVVTGACHRIADGVYHDFLNGASESLRAILYVNPILPSATFVRRKALLEVGMFDERIDFEEDWDLWLKLHERYGLECFHVTPQPVCFYWCHHQEREQKSRTKQVEGLPVREYFRKRYGATPI